MFHSVNPYTEETFLQVPRFSDNHIEKVLAQSVQALSAWSVVREDGVRAVQALASVLEHHKDALSRMITSEMGKPIKQSVSEVEKCSLLCRFVAEQASTFLADQQKQAFITHGDVRSRAYVTCQPLGVILSILP